MPATAQRIYELDTNDIINIAEKGKKRLVHSLVVYAESEEDAIEEAGNLVRRYFAFFGLSNE